VKRIFIVVHTITDNMQQLGFVLIIRIMFTSIHQRFLSMQPYTLRPCCD